MLIEKFEIATYKFISKASQESGFRQMRNNFLIMQEFRVRFISMLKVKLYTSLEFGSC